MHRDAALAIALGTEQDKIHVMLLDLVMPGRDGMDTLAELAKKRPDRERVFHRREFKTSG